MKIILVSFQIIGNFLEVRGSAEVKAVAGFRRAPIGVEKFFIDRLCSFVWPGQEVARSIGPPDGQVLADFIRREDCGRRQGIVRHG